MRCLFALLSVLAVLAAVGPAAVLAQDGTPAAAGSPLEGLGLPELRLTATDEGVAVPAEIEAGRYLVVLENPSAYDVEVSFILPPAGLTAAQLQATPGPEEGLPPAWYYEAAIAGGVSAGAGGTDRAILDLAPAGDWYAEVGRFGADDGGAATPAADLDETRPVPVAVTGEATPAAEPPLAVDATVELVDFDFVIPASLPAGPQVWQVTNAGAQPHHLVLFGVPGPITEEQAVELLELAFGMRGEDATPSPGLPAWAMDPAAFEAFEDAGYVPVLSRGRTSWRALDLAPGTYVAVCFVPDPETGMPHALMGMVAVATVGDGGTPAAGTPVA